MAWHFATKCAAVQFVKPWTSSHFSESRDPLATLVLPCDQNVFVRIGEASLATPTGKWSMGRPKSRWSDFLGPVLVWRQQNYVILLSTVRHFKSTWDCCPRNPPQRRSSYGNERMNTFLRRFSCLVSSNCVNVDVIAVNDDGDVVTFRRSQARNDRNEAWTTVSGTWTKNSWLNRQSIRSFTNTVVVSETFIITAYSAQFLCLQFCFESGNRNL